MYLQVWPGLIHVSDLHTAMSVSMIDTALSGWRSNTSRKNMSSPCLTITRSPLVKQLYIRSVRSNLQIESEMKSMYEQSNSTGLLLRSSLSFVLFPTRQE
jgi:hypothetical protein